MSDVEPLNSDILDNGDEQGDGDGQYDSEGYDEDGFDKDGFDRRGYDKDGYDRRGFDRDGRYRHYHGMIGYKNSEDGYDDEGYDEHGYDRQGYNRSGFNRDGYSEDGFRRDGKHRETGTKFDLEGYDIRGLDKDGFNRRGFKDGEDGPKHRITGTEFDPEGYDSRGINRFGFDKIGNRHHKDGQLARQWQYVDGYNEWGVDKDGYDRNGFDIKGYDRDGYNVEGLDKDGYTKEFNARFNQYGVDENGYLKNGELDGDVELAIDFARSGAKSQVEYASERKMEPVETRKRIEFARKKCPNLDQVISDLLWSGNKIRVATIMGDCNKFLGGEMSMEDFYDKHPKLTVGDMVGHFIDDYDKRREFADKTTEAIVMDSENIERNLQIFAASRYDVKAAIKGLATFRKEYTRFSTDGTPESIQRKRQNTKKLYEIEQYLSEYKNDKISNLIGTRYSGDGGKTWVEFTGERVGEAMEELKKAGRLVCTRTVKDYIVKNSEKKLENKAS